MSTGAGPVEAPAGAPLAPVAIPASTISSASYGDAADIFVAAYKSFQENLPAADQKDFKSFQNAQSMVTSIEELTKTHPINRSRLTSACRKFTAFTSKLEPYFEIVNIFVQVEPEYLGLIWGSLRLIFQLSSNYVTFLEKIADMFESIASILPAYEEFFNLLQQRAQSQGNSYPRLAKTLAFVYVDILRFCHSSCLLFSKKKRSARLKVSFIGRLLWQPFDMQFGDLTKRLEQHKQVFELEVSLASTAESLRFYTKYEDDIRRAEQLKGPLGTQQAVTPGFMRNGEMEILSNRARRLQEWINPPEWMHGFEEAESRRAPQTGDWILDEPIYETWRKRVSSSSGGSLGFRTLFIQAKPGYGKTVLCPILINDLGDYTVSPTSTAEHREVSVVFYFFDKRRAVSNRSTDAIRAMLAQLVHLHRQNQQAVDIASVLLVRNDTGQFTATDNEVFAVLTLLLDLLKFTYLVFEGIDECSDCSDLFKRIDAAASNSTSCGLLLLGRPTIQLPVKLNKDCLKIYLTKSLNSYDIEIFLRSEIQELIDGDFLPEDASLESILGLMIPRANGMFLWVRLLMDYLKLPSLTLRDRVHAIENLNTLEGLGPIYDAILDVLDSQFPGNSRLTVRRLFQWVAHSIRPLKLSELHCAVSVPFDRRQTKEDTIPNFEKSLGSLSGSLMELSSDESVQFVHLSAQEYFIGAGASSQETTNSRVLQYRNKADRHIAMSCLSYLVHSIPSEPLGGSSRVTPDHLFIRRKYPLLRYSAEYWSEHLSSSFMKELDGEHAQDSRDGSWSHLLDLLQSLLGDKRKITTWIEASWLERCPPAISLPSAIRSRPPTLPSAALSARLLGYLEEMLELETDLSKLNNSWSHVLRSEPNEIWEPSVQAFTASRFWITSPYAKLVRLGDAYSSSTKTICVQSQVSEDGTEIGIVKLVPSDLWLKTGGLIQGTGVEEIGSWKRSIISVEIDLSSKALSPFLTVPSSSRNTKSAIDSINPEDDRIDWQSSSLRPPSPVGDNFEDDSWKERQSDPTVSLPLAISNDLRRAVILNVAVEVVVPATSNVDESQVTQDQSNKTILRSQVLNLESRTTGTPARSDLRPNTLLSIYEDFYHMKFSPSGEYLVVIREAGEKARKGSDYYGALWLMQVFRDKGFKLEDAPDYVCIASTAFFAVPEISLLSPTRGVVFHPQLPRLAFPQVCDGLPQTYVWDFDIPITVDTGLNELCNPFPVHEPPIVDPYFSDDGKYLYGTDAPLEFGSGAVSAANIKTFSKPLIVEVPDYVKVGPSIVDSTEVSRIQTNPLQISTISSVAALELSKKEKGPVQKANTLSFDRDEGGIVHVSHLQQLEEEGAVVLDTFRTDGRFQSETLSRLPLEITHCVDVTLINSPTEQKSDTVRIVLNKAPQRRYTVADVSTHNLPAIIERKKESIPSFMTTLPMALDSNSHSNEFDDALLVLPGRGKAKAT